MIFPLSLRLSLCRCLAVVLPKDLIFDPYRKKTGSPPYWTAGLFVVAPPRLELESKV